MVFGVLPANRVELSTVTEQSVSIPTCACFHLQTFLDLYIWCFICPYTVYTG